ncbi:MAG: hypothetical protein ACO24B_01440 [Ilumatobacteraceae bacterium]
MKKMPIWDESEVEARTKELEREVARRLGDEGVDLILNLDPFATFDGFTERNGRRVSVCEVKTRTEPYAYFEQKGSFLFDSAKIDNLLRVAGLERLKAVLFVMTGDERLFFCPVKTMPESVTIEARKNHHSRDYVKKRVCLIPLEQFTEIIPKPKTELPDDIRWNNGRSWRTMGQAHRSEEILDYYRERMAIAIEDGGLSEERAMKQAEAETSAWLLARLREKTDKLCRLGREDG